MILTTKEFLTKVASAKVGKSCKIKKISKRNMEVTQRKTIFDLYSVNNNIINTIKRMCEHEVTYLLFYEVSRITKFF